MIYSFLNHGGCMRNCIICNVVFANVGQEKSCSVKCKIIQCSEKQGSGCWLWKSGSTGGYGKLRYKMKTTSAHRSSYTAFVGPVPEGKWVCHKCDKPLCVNPDHLFIGSPSDNRRDAIDKKRIPVGEDSHLSKFTDDQIEEIRFLKKEGFTYSRLMRIFACSLPHIYNIVHNIYRKT